MVVSESRSVVSDSLQPHGLCNPWNSPGQSTGVGICSSIPFSRGSSQPRDQTQVFHIACRFFTIWATREAHAYHGSVQFSRSVMSDYLRHHELQHARPPCPSPTPGVHSDSCSSSQWCHPVISSSVVPFSSSPQSLQHQSLFQWVNSSHEVIKVQEFQL